MELEPQKNTALVPTSPRVAHFVATHGDLEAVRGRLGLSKKKISELFWVEPSAWTRWTRGVSQPPEHIYRAIDLYLSTHSNADTSPRPRENEPTKSSGVGVKLDHTPLELLRLRDEVEELSTQLARVRSEKIVSAQRADDVGLVWKFLLLIALGLSLFELIF
jgi:hypothetical protein